MKYVLAKMIDTIVSLFETFSGVTNNFGKAGLGAGGLGLSAAVMHRMMVSPETERAIRDIMPERGMTNYLRGDVGEKMAYQPSDADFKGWRNEISLKMDKELNKLGIPKGAAALFKQRTGNLAYQIDRMCRKYTDPVVRNQKISSMIDREITLAVELARQHEDTGVEKSIAGERNSLFEKEVKPDNIVGGMKEQPAFFNGLTSSHSVPIWVTDVASDRLLQSSAEMDRLHSIQIEAMNKSERESMEKLNMQSIEEGIKKGVFTADDLLRKGTDMYAGGDNLLLARMGLVSKYEEYRASYLLNDTGKADRLWNEMKAGAMGYMQEVKGEAMNGIGQGIELAEKNAQHVNMGFGMKW